VAPTETCKQWNKLFPTTLLVGRISFRFCVNELSVCLSATVNDELHFSLYSLDWLWTGWSGVRMPAGARYLLCYPKHPDRLWGLPSFLFTGYRIPPPPRGGYGGQDARLSTHLHLLPRLRICGAILLLPLPLGAFITWTATTLVYPVDKSNFPLKTGSVLDVITSLFSS